MRRLDADKPFITELFFEKTISPNIEIKTYEEAITVVASEIKNYDREVMAAINFNTQKEPIGVCIAAIGTQRDCQCSPREIFKSAYLQNAAYILIMHNHINGILNPSNKDNELTDACLQTGVVLDIPLIDHAIVGTGCKQYYSFKEQKLMDFVEPKKRLFFNNKKRKLQ